MDYGFEAAGFRTAVTLEMEANCCRTLRANRNWPVIESDIIPVTTAQLLATAGLRRKATDLLIGGPPCQPFSKSGYWATGDSKRLSDPRANTLTAYLRVVEEALPRAFVLENVTGLAFAGKDEGLQYFLSEIERINHHTRSHYRPAYRVLKAVEHGVPQLRERLFIVASRDGQSFDFPAPRFGEEKGADLFGNLCKLEPFRTAWDAIGDLPDQPDGEDLNMRGRWADLLPSVPEGQNYLWHTDRGGGVALFGWRRRFWNFLLKLAKDRPAWTIQAQPGPSTGPFHWNNRRLSLRELCRLQTFPDDVTITGSRIEAHRQIGNAVPSLLAEVLGREILRQFFGRRTSGELKLLPLCRAPYPPPEATTSVPRKYLVNVGTETAHPGTGRGYRAHARQARSVA
jgi:DNA (cytosine-5)-methyltransferase 1